MSDAVDQRSSRQNYRSVTFWALGPYLVLYRLFGLIPIVQSMKNPLSGKISDRITWSSGLATFYSAAVIAVVMKFIYDEVPAFEALVSNDSAIVLQAANNFSICLNVFFTLVTCFAYLGRRLIRLVEEMMRCEHDISLLDCYLPKWVAIYSWLAFFVGIVAVITNEATIHAKYYRLSVENSSFNSFEGFFHASVTPLAAAIWIFVDLSVIHLSFIASCYQRQLRHQIDRWAEHDLQFKEKIRMAYKTVQSIVKKGDDIFSPMVLIGSLSCVAHLILQIHYICGSRIDFSPTFNLTKDEVMTTSAITLFYLVIRFLMSSLFTEMVPEEKTKSLQSLYYQSEKILATSDLDLLITKRFVHQLTLPSGFTGCGFFTLGKSYLLAMCGTILTYEIVLIDMAKKASATAGQANLNQTSTISP